MIANRACRISAKSIPKPRFLATSETRTLPVSILLFAASLKNQADIPHAIVWHVILLANINVDGLAYGKSLRQRQHQRPGVTVEHAKSDLVLLEEIGFASSQAKEKLEHGQGRNDIAKSLLQMAPEVVTETVRALSQEAYNLRVEKNAVRGHRILNVHCASRSFQDAPSR